MTHHLHPLIAQLRGIFAKEGCAEGDAAAQALGALDALPPMHIPAPPIDLGPMVSLVEASPNAWLAPLLPRLSWRSSGLKDGRIRPEIAHQMLTCELLGPTGMIPHDTVKLGLFYQAAQVNYVTRTHAAAETFFILSGEADWFLEDRPARRLRPGDVTHHPSLAPHASVTQAFGTLAAWRWSGDLRFETYQMLG